jgi:hypothetical protein
MILSERMLKITLETTASCREADAGTEGSKKG